MGDGTDRWFASRRFALFRGTLDARKFVRNRHDGPANSRSLALEFHCGNTCVPRGSSGFSILTATSNNGEKP